jgi:pimeloyl-ACP methyl ester carboxylesterase
MASFILVHGSTQNAGCWSAVTALLKRHGHQVVTPELPKRAPGWGFDQYAAAIARCIETSDTVVVAHSMSGAFLPLVPLIRPCAALVFLAAAIPEPGRSARDQCLDDPPMLSAAWMSTGARWFDESQRELLARTFLFHDCDDETIARALGTIELLDATHLFTVPHPLLAWPGVPTVSIVATLDRTISPTWTRQTTRRVLGVEPIEIETGHCPHVSQPERVASMLERLVPGQANRA